MIDSFDSTGQVRMARYSNVLPYVTATKDFGRENISLLFVKDITKAHHDWFAARPDVIAVPDDLDASPSATAVANIQAFLESHKVPSGWINTGRTYRQIIRVLHGLFGFLQRWIGVSPSSGERNPFNEGVTLSTTYADMPEGVRTRLRTCFDLSKVDYSELTGASTFREILYEFGKQHAARPIKVNGEVI